MTTILSIIIALLAIAVIVLLITRPRIVEVADEAPTSLRKRDGWLKLQNEGKEYLKYKDGKVYLRIVK